MNIMLNSETKLGAGLSTRSKAYYTGIQDLRGWAALIVVLYHVHVLFKKEKYFDIEIAAGVFEFGHRGVDLFFVISGFLMAMLTSGPQHNHRASHFLLARARRIYIPYIPIMLALSSVCLFAKNVCPSAYSFNAAQLLSNLFIVPRENLDTFVPVVAWTLAHEIFFYLMTFASLLLKKLGRAVFIGWLLASVFVNVIGLSISFPVSFILSPYNLAFGLGYLAFNLHGVILARVPSKVCLHIGILSFMLLGLIESIYGAPLSRLPALLFMWSFFLASFLLVLGFMNRRASWIHQIGNASYSIYLVHYPLLVLLCMLAKRFVDGAVPALLLFMILSITAIVGGYVYYLILEKPSLRFFDRLVKQ
jgi:exopolysaccharide production protein ExoZ